MNKYYEVKVRLERTLENGMVKKVKEPYLFDALSFSEAETRAIEELAPFTSGEPEVTDIKRATYTEVIPNNSESASKWYAVRANFIVLDERTGKEKKSRHDLLVQSHEINDARKTFEHAMAQTMTDYEIVSIKETPIMDVFPYQEKGERQ